jgi:hypothetical protein
VQQNALQATYGSHRCESWFVLAKIESACLVYLVILGMQSN